LRKLALDFPDWQEFDKPGKMARMPSEPFFPANQESSALPCADDLHGSQREIMP